jgi:transcriptional regulator with XRE-family HTH domain
MATMSDEKTFYEQLMATEEGKRLFKREEAVMEVTEFICGEMEKRGVTRSELAKRLGKTKRYITQLLDGGTNMTVRTIADVCHALGCEFHVSSQCVQPAVQARKGGGTRAGRTSRNRSRGRAA